MDRPIWHRQSELHFTCLFMRWLQLRSDFNLIAIRPRRNARSATRVWADALRVKQAVREVATICPRPCKLTFDLLTSKMVSESRVTWPTSVPILVFLGLSVLDLGPM